MKLDKYFTRMGDGSGIYMTAEEIRKDILKGVKGAADRGKIPELTQEEMDYLFKIVTLPGNIVGVGRGREVVSTSNSGSCKMTYHANEDRRCQIICSGKTGGKPH